MPFEMNSGNIVRQSQSSQNRNSNDKPFLAGCTTDEHLGLFNVAETIQRLCDEGMLDKGVPGRIEQPTRLGQSTANVSITLPSFDMLSKSFLESIVNHIASTLGVSIGLMVTSKTGRIVQIVDRGWSEGSARTQKTVLGKIARESTWQPSPRLSIGAIAAECAGSPLEIGQTRGSVCLNELSEAVGTPLLLLPIPLEASSGFAVFFCDATECKTIGPVNYLAKACQLGLDNLVLADLVRQLDAWLILQRCDGFMRAMGSIDWVLSQPRWWLFPIVTCCLALFTPVPYRPSRDCVFEPESKQFLSSPIQGRIASCGVRPGDNVDKSELLARIDDDQLQRDLATARAELDGAKKKRDSALATKAAGVAGLADIEMEQAALRIESIEDQLSRMEIRATAAGVVVQGDWHRSIGMPVTLGQNLFEVAELESMNAEVRLNTSDLGIISVGDSVTIRSDASGGATFSGKISRIEPRATVIDEAAVFVADVAIRDPELKLRPGMKATAQIRAGWKSLGWILFNRPYRWIANQWIW